MATRTDALGRPLTRAHRYPVQLVVQVSTEDGEAIYEEAARRGVSKSEVVRGMIATAISTRLDDETRS